MGILYHNPGGIAIRKKFRRISGGCRLFIFLLSAKINSEPFGRRIRSKFTFSFATAITVASAVSAAETAAAATAKAILNHPLKMRLSRHPITFIPELMLTVPSGTPA